MTILHTILARKLTGINVELNSINCGGCGHYAYELNQALAEHDVDSSIVLVAFHHFDVDDVDELINDVEGAFDINSAYRIRFANGTTNGAYVSPCLGHICLNVEGILYDSKGIWHGRAISERIEPDAMALVLAHAPTWNQTFEYSNENAVPTMKAYIHQALLPLGEG